MKRHPFVAAALGVAVLLLAPRSSAQLENTTWAGAWAIRYSIPGVGAETLGYPGAGLTVDANNAFTFTIPGLNTYTGTVDYLNGTKFRGFMDQASLDQARVDMINYALTYLDAVDVQTFTATIAGKVSKDGSALVGKLKETAKGTGTVGGKTRKGAIKARGLYVAVPGSPLPKD